MPHDLLKITKFKDSPICKLVPWAGSKTYTMTFCSNCFLKWSHAVLSVIFGILGKFPIGIGNQKKSSKVFFVEKNSNTFWSKKKLVEKYFLGWFFLSIEEKKLDQKFCRPKKFDRFFFRSIFFGQNLFSTDFFSTIFFRKTKIPNLV